MRCLAQGVLLGWLSRWWLAGGATGPPLGITSLWGRVFIAIGRDNAQIVRSSGLVHYKYSRSRALASGIVDARRAHRSRDTPATCPMGTQSAPTLEMIQPARSASHPPQTPRWNP
jgi:hypothetical protein